MATKTAPYSVNEKIKIEIMGDKVVGTKIGNQSGPDLTNGYFGDLNGSIKDNILELVYSYTVEGANGKELENYEFQDGSLVKMRWPLISKNKILVPDKTGEPQKQIYNKVLCESKIAEPSVPNEPTLCTMEAKLCPDGSYVGRTGPKCQFVCP